MRTRSGIYISNPAGRCGFFPVLYHGGNKLRAAVNGEVPCSIRGVFLVNSNANLNFHCFIYQREF